MTGEVSAPQVLSFWIDEIGPKGWYERSDALDAQIGERFGTVHAHAAEGALDGWAHSAEGALALLILLDQFSRNLFRDDGRAFATDAKALAIAKGAVEAGHDLEIAQPERQFFYLPYMHSEDLTDQHACVALISERMTETTNLHHARVHRAVIERFGRFPYRNAALGRVNMPEEQAYTDAGLYEPEGWSDGIHRTPPAGPDTDS